MTKADEDNEEGAARRLLETTPRPRKPTGLTPSKTRKPKK